MKVYAIILKWATDDYEGLEVFVHSTYEKAVAKFNRFIQEEHDPEMSWASDAFDENDNVDDSFELDRSPEYTDGEEHELWWKIRNKNDWFFYDDMELRILEVE